MLDMTTKKWTTKEGRIPGSGMRQEDVTTRPDDASLVSRVQLKFLVGVSNPAVVTKALERLGIQPADEGSKTRSTYKNGGQGVRMFDVPYYESSIAQAVRIELQVNAVNLGGGRFRYQNTTFRWRGSNRE